MGLNQVSHTIQIDKVFLTQYAPEMLPQTIVQPETVVEQANSPTGAPTAQSTNSAVLVARSTNKRQRSPSPSIFRNENGEPNGVGNDDDVDGKKARVNFAATQTAATSISSRLRSKDYRRR